MEKTCGLLLFLTSICLIRFLFWEVGLQVCLSVRQERSRTEQSEGSMTFGPNDLEKIMLKL